MEKNSAKKKFCEEKKKCKACNIPKATFTMTDSFSDSDSYDESGQEDEEQSIPESPSQQGKKQTPKKKKGEKVKDEDLDIVLKIKIDDDSPPKRDKGRKFKSPLWNLSILEYVFLIEGDNGDITIQSFVHPKTGKMCKYALKDDGKKIFEIQRFKRIPSSYFIDEEVKDGMFPFTPSFQMKLARLHQTIGQ